MRIQAALREITIAGLLVRSALVRKGLPITLTERHGSEQSLETGRSVGTKAWIVASNKLTFKSVRFEQNISGDPLSFHLQELPQPVHSLNYAVMHHSVTSCDRDVIACASHKGVELGHEDIYAYPKVPIRTLSLDWRPA